MTEDLTPEEKLKDYEERFKAIRELLKEDNSTNANTIRHLLPPPPRTDKEKLADIQKGIDDWARGFVGQSIEGWRLHDIVKKALK